MKKKITTINLIKPKNQLFLFGFDRYFSLFKKLFDSNRMPNCILLSGAKGIGKATFSYHLVNFILSIDENESYSIKDCKINENNSSYKQISSNTHPNFFLINNKFDDEEIKIDQIRNLIKFLNKSTYSKDLKIVLIDNFETLNLNSTNALLKSIEEPDNNTFFFLINSNPYKLAQTLKSRCIEFKISFSEHEKKNIFKNIITQLNLELELSNLGNNLFFDTPGNVLKYYLYLKENQINLKDNNLLYVKFFLESFVNKKSLFLINSALYFIEKFYNQLSYNNLEKISLYSQNYSKILREVHSMKRFNLYEKNTLMLIEDILLNESK